MAIAWLTRLSGTVVKSSLTSGTTFQLVLLVTQGIAAAPVLQLPH